MEVLTTIGMFLGICMLIPFALAALIIALPLILYVLYLMAALILGLFEFITILVRGHKK